MVCIRSAGGTGPAATVVVVVGGTVVVVAAGAGVAAAVRTPAPSTWAESMEPPAVEGPPDDGLGTDVVVVEDAAPGTPSGVPPPSCPRGAPAGRGRAPAAAAVGARPLRMACGVLPAVATS